MNESNLDLNDLRAAWTQLHAETTAVRADIALAEARRSNRWLYVKPAVHLALCAAALLVTGNFVADNWAQVQAYPLGLSPALGVYLTAIATINVEVRQIMAIREMDAAQDVVTLAERSARREQQEVAATVLLLGLGLVTWVAFPILLGQMLLNYRLVESIPAPFLVANVLFGAALAWGLLRAFRHQRWSQVLTNLLAGRAGAELKRESERIREFGQG